MRYIQAGNRNLTVEIMVLFFSFSFNKRYKYRRFLFAPLCFGCSREQFVDWQSRPVLGSRKSQRIDQSSDLGSNDTALTARREMSLLHMTTDAGATAGGSQMASTAGSPPFEKKKKKQPLLWRIVPFPGLNLMGRCDRVADRKLLTEIKIEQKVSSWCHEGFDCWLMSSAAHCSLDVWRIIFFDVINLSSSVVHGELPSSNCLFIFKVG